MNSTDERANEPTMGCDELKATLSAYLDDELARGERFRADAHLVACAACRGLVERAEELDQSLRRDLEADIAEVGEAVQAAIASAGSAAMEAAVFARIGAEHRRTWLPRIAAAAVVAFLLGGSFLAWKSWNAEQPLAPAGVGVFARGGLVSEATPRRAAPGIAPPTLQASAFAALSPDDRQALYATSLILDAARRTAFGDRARREELRQTARYDELVDRLNDVLVKLPAEERAAVALARDATERIASSTDDADDWRRLQEDVAVRDLDRQVDELSDIEEAPRE